MIKHYLLNRQELIDMIYKAPKTQDGIYYFPRFKILSNLQGKYNDSEYFYSRDIFKKKMCFSATDIKLFLSKKEEICDINLISFIDNKLEDTLKGIEFLDLKDKIPNNDFTLEELIDTCIYLTKEKYE